VIATKYDVGDKVWVADYVQVNEHVECPDCLGTGIWQAILPNGEVFPIPCPTCAHGYQGSRGFVDGPYVYGPKVWEGTVGSIGVDTYSSKEDERIRYVLKETGIGSGTVYYEALLYVTEAEALVAAVIKAGEHTRQLQDQYLKGLTQKKKNRPGSLVAYLRTDRTRLLKQVDQIDRHLSSIQTPKTPEVK
jgi:hypothetical protein